MELESKRVVCFQRDLTVHIVPTHWHERPLLLTRINYIPSFDHSVVWDEITYFIYWA